MDDANSFKASEPYLAYCRHTDEKDGLLNYIGQELGSKSITNILDLGAGNGVVTAEVADLFPDAHLDAVERSKAQVEHERFHNKRDLYTPVYKFWVV